VSGSFDALFDRFRHTAFRYEGLPAYLVDEEAPRIQAWREHRARPERSVRTSDWLRRIAVTTAQGKEWTRVRAVDWPLPEYLRYELAGYVENQAAGDRTFLVDREHASIGRDFWMFDGGTDQAVAALMNYDGAGRFQEFELVTDTATLADLEATRVQLLEHAVALNEWLARLETSVA
jgi:hypothetical protein